MTDDKVQKQAVEEVLKAVPAPIIPIEQGPIQLDKEFKFTTYLIGAMQITAEKDGGGEKRENLDKELRLRNVFPINPVKLEASKTGMSSEEITSKMKGWVASGCWDKFGEQAINIWKGRDYVETTGNLKHIPGDITYVTMSTWFTFRLNSGDQPCGSYMECGIAMEHNIPIYLITDIPKKELKQSLLQAILVTQGEVFRTENEYLAFIDKKYDLKRKNEA